MICTCNPRQLANTNPEASRLLLLPPPPPPLPPPALRTRDFSCTTLTASFPLCPEKCDRSPKEFPQQVRRPKVWMRVRTPRWVRGRPAVSGTRLTFRVNFPRDSGGSPAIGAGAGTWTGASLGSSRRCLPASVPCALSALPPQTFRLEFSLMCLFGGCEGEGQGAGIGQAGRVRGRGQ